MTAAGPGGPSITTNLQADTQPGVIGGTRSTGATDGTGGAGGAGATGGTGNARELIATLSGAWMWLLLALLAGLVMLVIARGLARGSGGWGSLGGSWGGLGGSRKRRRPTDTRSAWVEAGRRMAVPPADEPDVEKPEDQRPRW